MKFKKAALGGTFSLIHKGHKELITTAFHYAERVIVGISSEYLVSTLKKAYKVPRYRERLRKIYHFLLKKGFLSRAKIFTLIDPYGPTLFEKDLEIIVVSDKRIERALEIAKFRVDHNYSTIQSLVVKKLVAEDGYPISCTRIMRGEIDVEGRILHSEY